MPLDELREFLLQIHIPYSNAYEYILGIEYPKPFSEYSTRWTKALILIYLTSLMLVNFNFSKKYSFDYRVKIFINLFFISGIFIFKSALMRSDGVHLKSSSGIYTLVFIFLIILLSFQKFEIENHIILPIGERVRDIIYIEELNKIFTYLESSSSIAIIDN